MVLIIHIVTSVLDSFTSISLTAAVIPFVSSYLPRWLGLGTLAFELMLALIVTSLLRRRIGLRTWRAIHWFAYASWPIAVLHGLGTGSDAKSVWSVALTAACVIAVMIALLTRLGAANDRYRGPAIVATLLVPLGIAVFTLAGPLQARVGQPRRAPPASLLAPKLVASRSRPSVSTPTRPRSTLKVPFSAHLDGTVSQTNVSGGAIVDLSLRLSSGAHGKLACSPRRRAESRWRTVNDREPGCAGGRRPPLGDGQEDQARFAAGSSSSPRSTAGGRPSISTCSSPSIRRAEPPPA